MWDDTFFHIVTENIVIENRETRRKERKKES